MKIIMYGSEICPDCVEAKELLSSHRGIQFDYRNITATTTTLKEFLSYRDNDPIFVPVKEGGRIGIPFFILEDGTKTFELSDIIEFEKSQADSSVIACSIDGKGNC
ncbi:MAG: hypothetical protein K0R00_2612 [Herbinix sp.]|jgi:glutaredoxin-related protein|nr:hypothetical protein [Herbinix sp.]